MVDWGIMAKVCSGYGVNIIVLIILLVVAMIVGKAVQRSEAKGKESQKKG